MAIRRTLDRRPLSSQTLDPPSPPDSRPQRGEALRALAIVFALTGALALIQLALPWTASGMQLGLAIVLLQAPTWVMRSTPADEARLGMTLGPWRPGLALGVGTMAIVFPLFVLGFHVVHTELLDRRADWSLQHLVRWDESLELAPPTPCGRAGGTAAAWLQGHDLWLVAPAQAELSATLVTPPPVPEARAIRCLPGRGPVVGARLTPGPGGAFSLARGEGLWVRLGERTAFELRLSERGAPLPAERLRLGASAAEADDDGGFEASRSAWWLLTYILVHLGLVALPEEWFFRGYLQPRLDARFGTPRRLWGAQVGWGFVLAALAFALLHPILIPGAHRLLVFFPALLFGWLRARSGNVGAAVLVHAGSNVLLAIVSRMYL